MSIIHPFYYLHIPSFCIFVLEILKGTIEHCFKKFDIFCSCMDIVIDYGISWHFFVINFGHFCHLPFVISFSG